MPVQVRGLDRIKTEFKRFQFTGPKTQKRFLTLIGQETVSLMKELTPRDTSELANNWRIIAQGTDSIEVGFPPGLHSSGMSYIELATLLQEGSPPHLIVPREGDRLRFEVGGQEIFKTEILHPGFRGIRFIDTGAGIMADLIISTLKNALRAEHPYFASLRDVGGKGRRFQQVGRTSAGLAGGVRFSGRSTLVRAGTGR
ncbi:MAG: HK97 gp10 family phage protein, partial [Nitrosopumilaceae archaeon]